MKHNLEEICVWKKSYLLAQNSTGATFIHYANDEHCNCKKCTGYEKDMVCYITMRDEQLKDCEAKK